jgi:DNA invertase Pin-like site-specific DNA recombinase
MPEYSPHAPFALFVAFCSNTRIRCSSGRTTPEDRHFIEHLPEYAEFFGVRPSFAERIHARLRGMLENSPRRAKPQAHRYDPRVVEMVESGMSLRETARTTGHTKANVERTLREHRIGQIPLPLDFGP